MLWTGAMLLTRNAQVAERYVHDIDPGLSSVAGVHLWWYGLGFALGFLHLHRFLVRDRVRLGLSRRDAWSLSLLLTAGIVTGGRAVEIAFDEWPFYRLHPNLIPAFWLGGMATHGLLIGGAAATALFAVMWKRPFLALADSLVIPGAFLMGVGRLGNFIDGQIVGSVTDLWWGVKFPYADGFRHPVVLYDGIKNLLLVPYLLHFYCQRVTLTNFTIDYLVAPYTHARLSSVDQANRRLHYTPIGGWPDPVMFGAAASAIETSNVVALVFRDGRIVPGSTRMPVQALTSGTVELFQNTAPWTQGPTLSTFQPGDTLVVTYRGGGPPLDVWHGDEVTISSGRILGAGNWAINMERSSNSTVDSVRVEPRPGGLIGSTADGIHVSQGYRNNHIRNCYVTRTVDDALIIDALSVATIVAQPGPRALQVRRIVYSRFPNGSLVNFVDLASADEIPGGAIVSQDPPDARTLEYGGLVSLTFDRDLPPLTPGSTMVFADGSMRGSGSTVEDNLVEDIPFGRGIWISGAVGTTVQRNVIRTTSSGGITVSHATPVDPGPPVRDLTIQSNALERNLGPAASGTGTQTSMAAIIVESLGPQFRFATGALNDNVVVRDNYIVDSGRAGIWMGEVSGGGIENNFIARWYQQPQLPIWGIPSDLQPQVIEDHAQAIVVRHSAGVAETSNDVRPFSAIAAPVSFPTPVVVVPSGAGTSSIGVVPVVPGFQWRPASQDAWISVASSVTAGPGTFSFNVAPNTGAARTGRISVAGQTLTVVQASATALATPGWIALAPPLVSGGAVTLNWSVPVGGQPASSFTIVASLSPGGPPIASLPVGAVQSLTVPAPVGAYYVRVVGVNAAGAGPTSNEVMVVVGDGGVPAAPDNLTAS